MNMQKILDLLTDFEQILVLSTCYRSQWEKEYVGVLAMLTKKEGRICLWEICRTQENTKKRRRKKHTNRSELKADLNQELAFFIKQIQLKQYSFHVCSAEGICLSDPYQEWGRILLLYFLQNGIDLNIFEQIPLEELMINCYEMEEQDFPKVNEKLTSFQITLEEQYIPVEVHKRLQLKIGQYAKPRLVKLKGKEEITVYVHGIQLYDIWKEAEEYFRDEQNMKQFSKRQRKKIKQQYMEMLSQNYPKGTLIPLIEYECDKDYQMQFYTLDYLRKPSEKKANTGILFFRADEKKGPMGYRKRLCALEEVKQGYEGVFLTELFFYYERVPEKNILVHLSDNNE